MSANSSTHDEDSVSRHSQLSLVYQPKRDPSSLQYPKRNVSYTQQELQGFKEEIRTEFHMMTIPQLCQYFATHAKNGLSEEQAQIYLEEQGPNGLTPPEKESEILKFIKTLFSGFAILLWVGAVLCFGVYYFQRNSTDAGLKETADDNLYLGSVLAVIVFVTGVFTYYQERKSSKIMESFQNMMPQTSNVIRNSIRKTIPIEDIVLGDLVVVRIGDKFPADVRLTEVNGLKVDNSALTGESEPQGRSVECTNPNPLETKNMAFFSTNVLEGEGRGIVVARGDNSVMGRIAELASGLDKVETPIHKEFVHFIRIITCVSVFFGVTFFTISIAMGHYYVSAIIFLIAIIVANVPEGLMVTMTVCLTLSAKRMAKKNCLVKNLEAVETLGSTSIICSDKTGTLTQNRMTVAHLWYDDTIVETPTSHDSTIPLIKTMTFTYRALMNVAILCNKSEFLADQEKVDILQRKTVGDASESAVLKYTEMVQGNVAQFRKNYPKVFEVPFNSMNKYQISIHKVPNQAEHLMVMKGAPEKIIERCSTILIRGDTKPIDKATMDRFNNAYTIMASKGERVLGFCDMTMSKEKYPQGFVFKGEPPNYPTSGMRFVGLIALIDPPRASVPNAVQLCRSAGIQVIMVTGDHPLTAQAIATQVGIISEGSETLDEVAKRLDIPINQVDRRLARVCVVSGSQLREMEAQELDSILENYPEIVFARTSPTQKLLIVEGCQRRGDIVAVTGDGVNDSPALKKADIGVAMGISGSEVAKNAADMILLDDNFSSIVTGIEEGRLIFDNLKKSIAFTLTANTPEMTPFLSSIVFGIPIPLNVIGILCINVGTDLFPSISLAYENAETDIMRRRPRDPFRDKLVNSRLIMMAYVQIGSMQAAAGFFVYFIVMAQHNFYASTLFGLRENWDKKETEFVQDSFGNDWNYEDRKKLESRCHTSFFLAIVLVQLVDMVICKTRVNSIVQQGMHNWVFNVAFLSVILLTFFLIYTPHVNDALKMVPLGYTDWLLVTPFCLLIFVFDELRRMMIRRHPGGWVERETYY